MTQRTLESFIRSHPSSDGDGVKIRRLALFNQRQADPFLMLDELVSDDEKDYMGGFPPHPHRGMETLTYLRKGALIHRDHLGNRGEIRSGGAQWMSAGKGIIHSEMPERDLGGLHGFQLWINLPAAEKMCDPKYRDVTAEEIPVVTLNDEITATVIAGEWNFEEGQVTGPLMDLSASAGYLDLFIPAGASIALPVNDGERAIAYVYQGALSTGQTLPDKTLLVYSTQGDEVTLKADSDSRVLFLTGQPILEPVAHYGPFVMNTTEEIEQAIRDYNSGQFGR
ncbi:pirin family protein [uncultured Thalassolituus sp.]|uniref:pirin family protein n=1 Tax=uncultured Thalassolituus sp. TaxID=285273 RepID=UPI00261C8A07|nr:pirin family protein [uncultured Thalassolituus sp.]